MLASSAGTELRSAGRRSEISRRSGGNERLRSRSAGSPARSVRGSSFSVCDSAVSSRAKPRAVP